MQKDPYGECKVPSYSEVAGSFGLSIRPAAGYLPRCAVQTPFDEDPEQRHNWRLLRLEQKDCTMTQIEVNEMLSLWT